MEQNTKEQLAKDLSTLVIESWKVGRSFSPIDVFAIGYIAGKYGLDKLIDNQNVVLDACEEYDKTNDLKLPDSIKETLMDLDVIPGRIHTV